QRHRLHAAAAHRQLAAQIEAGVDAFVGVDGGEIARAQPPQHAMHATTRPRRDRTEALGIDDEAPARKHRDADRLGVPPTPAHERAAHVRSIGEMQRHPVRLAELRSGATQRAASRAGDGCALMTAGRVAAQIERAIAIGTGAKTSTKMPVATYAKSPGSAISVAIRKNKDGAFPG